MPQDLEKSYVKGANIWVKNIQNQWDKAIIQTKNSKGFIVATLSDKNVIAIYYKNSANLPALCLPDDDLQDEKRNLTNLIVKHNATIINVFKLRFERQCLYHYCGIGMAFVNPYVKQPASNYNKMMSYRGKPIGTVKPHIFAIAENAYQRLERENRNQSIIFSGEAGSGKTENAKQAISYLVNISAKESQVKEKILAITTVLEAFGNAKTRRNDNSSRFIKYIEMHYDSDYHIIGASLKCYMIDKSRIILKDNTADERNFNIFYQLHSTKKKTLCCKLKEGKLYFLDRGELLYSPSPDDINDSKSFDDTSNALKVLGFSRKEQNEILRILLAIVYLGNLEFKSCKDRVHHNVKGCAVSNLNHLDIVLKAFDITSKDTSIGAKWFCQRSVHNRFDCSYNPMTLEQALKARDELAKYIYVKLFNWLVTRINAFFQSPFKVESFIGILDFPGNENNQNSFEQFCINYCNEKIQQHYNHSIFKLEQMEYMRDDIEWYFFAYKDNKNILFCLEGTEGIIPIIERNTKPKKDFKKGLLKRFSKDNPYHFEVRHFLNHIQYDLKNFIEKNHSMVLKEQLRMLTGTQNEVLQKIISEDSFLSKENTRLPNNELLNSFKLTPKKTVMQEVRTFIQSLTLTMIKTFPHYVRCIKSNDEKTPYKFDSRRITEQIEALALEDLINISALGYFSQRTYEDFVQRYRCLYKFKRDDYDDLKEACRMIILTCLKDYDYIRFSNTKVYIREDDIQHLEKLRTEKRLLASILIQKTVRRFLCTHQKRYQENHTSYFTSRTSAAIVIQKNARRFLARCKYIRTMRNIIKAQACARRFLAKRAAERLMRWHYGSIELLNGKNCWVSEFDVLQAKIIYLATISHKAQLWKEIEQILDERKCVQDESKMSNTNLFENIDTLKELSKTNEKDLELQKVEHEKQDCGEHHKSTDGDKLLEDKPSSTLNNISNKEEFSKVHQHLFATYHKLDKIATTLNQFLDRKAHEIANFKDSIKKFEENYERLHLEYNNNTDEFISSLVKNKRKIFVEEKEHYCYEGMFYCNDDDVHRLIIRLIDELDIESVIRISVDFPAQILFMCIRYFDSIRDSPTVAFLFETYVKAVKHTIKQLKQKQFDVTLYWLVNTYRLLNYLKQYSKISEDDKVDEFHESNTFRQNKQCLKYLDLSYQWDMLEDTCQWIAKEAVKQMKRRTAEFLLPAVLDNKKFADLMDVLLHKTQSFPQSKLGQLLNELTSFNLVLKKFQVARTVTVAMFKQFFDFLSNLALSSIMSRKKLRNKRKGMYIGSNVRILDKWATNNRILITTRALTPLRHAVRLLQMQSIEADVVDWISQNCNTFNESQIKKILDSYLSTNKNEDSITEEEFTEEEKYPITFPFQHSPVAFEDVEVPESFKLSILIRI